MKLFRRKHKIQVFTVANGDLYHAYLEKIVIIIRERLKRIASGSMEMSGYSCLQLTLNITLIKQFYVQLVKKYFNRLDEEIQTDLNVE
jgi:hypothetical protein